MSDGDIPSTNKFQAPDTLETSDCNSDVRSEPSSSSNIVEPDANFASSDALARGISSTLGAVITDFDGQAVNTLKSQDQLSSALDRLTGELDQLLEDAPLPFIMQHAARISGVRKRVSSLNSLLKSIQRRIDNIDRMLSAGLLNAKATTKNVQPSAENLQANTENSGQH